jgi:hypothetical protein
MDLIEWHPDGCRIDEAAEVAASVRTDLADARKRLRELADAEKESRKKKRAAALALATVGCQLMGSISGAMYGYLSQGFFNLSASRGQEGRPSPLCMGELPDWGLAICKLLLQPTYAVRWLSAAHRLLLSAS